MALTIGWVLSVLLGGFIGAVLAATRRPPAETGPMPRTGDIVRITDRASAKAADAPVDRFRVIHADPIPGRAGWCCLRGWDMDADRQRYTAHDVRTAGLAIYLDSDR